MPLLNAAGFWREEHSHIVAARQPHAPPIRGGANSGKDVSRWRLRAGGCWCWHREEEELATRVPSADRPGLPLPLWNVTVGEPAAPPRNRETWAYHLALSSLTPIRTRSTNMTDAGTGVGVINIRRW